MPGKLFAATGKLSVFIVIQDIGLAALPVKRVNDPKHPIKMGNTLAGPNFLPSIAFLIVRMLVLISNIEWLTMGGAPRTYGT
jgi:hypothetical protein